MRDGKIIAEAFHSGFGKPHAERQLFEKYEPRTSPASAGRYRAPQKISAEDVLYVNLEPCCHSDKKTPPCVQYIIDRGVKKLVFGMIDPNPLVAGKGISVLKKAGIEVIGPVIPEECARLNRGFISLMTNSRPWITLKSARTISGQFANPKGSRLMITSEEQDRWAHAFLRARHDAILVGVGTVLSDDPRLNVRYMDDPPEIFRIVLDAGLRIPLTARVVTPPLAGRTIVIAAPGADTSKSKALRKKGILVHGIPYKNGVFDWPKLWSVLVEPKGNFYGITSILVEGGLKTWEAFHRAGFVDEEVTLVGLR